MSHFRSAAGDRIKGFKCGNELSGGIERDVQSSIAHFPDKLCQVFCPNT